MKYTDITIQILKQPKKQFRVIEQHFFIDSDGIRYDVDNIRVVFEPSKREIEVANILGELYGGNINLIPRINEPEHIKTPDYIINGEKFDLKEIIGNGKNTLYDALSHQKRQANNFIFDISNTEMFVAEAIRQINVIYTSQHRKWVDKILLIRNNTILKYYKRG